MSQPNQPGGFRPRPSPFGGSARPSPFGRPAPQNPPRPESDAPRPKPAPQQQEKSQIPPAQNPPRPVPQPPLPTPPQMSPFATTGDPLVPIYQQRRVERRNLLDIRPVEAYELIEQIGEGTYGQVFRAKEKQTGEIVAMKKVRMENEKEGFPITAIREVKLLKSLSHTNVVQLREIVISKATEHNKNKGSIYLCFEYLDHDLTGLMDTPGVHFTVPQIKCYMKQLLAGLDYLHKRNVLHRDIKGSNLLIGNNGMLKLADFGLARPYNKEKEKVNLLTNHVITLWYRPPELLLGAKMYGPAVDMWSVGCLLGELLLRHPLFPGKTEACQLDHIFKTCGTPTNENWPEHASLPDWDKRKPEKNIRRCLKEKFANCQKASPQALDLLEKLLTLDPTRRMTAGDALDHDYFWSEPPLPCEPSALPVYKISAHEWQAKKRKANRQGQAGPNNAAAGAGGGAQPYRGRPAPSAAAQPAGGFAGYGEPDAKRPRNL